MNRKKYRWRVAALVVWCLFTLAVGSALVYNIYTGVFGWKLWMWALQTFLGVANIIEKMQRVNEARRQLA